MEEGEGEVEVEEPPLDISVEVDEEDDEPDLIEETEMKSPLKIILNSDLVTTVAADPKDDQEEAPSQPEPAEEESTKDQPQPDV